MRIAYLTQSYSPMISGAAIVVEKLATAMAERGHEVLVIAASDREYPYTVRHKNLTILRLKSVHNPMRVNQRFLMFPYFAILGALRKFQPDVIHAHEPLQPAWAGITYARSKRIPIALTVHQVPTLLENYLPDLPALRTGIESVLWSYSRWLIKQFQSIITPSHATARLLASRTGVQALTISNGIDLQAFHPGLPSADITAARHMWDLPECAPLLLHVGRLDAEKRVDRILQACAPVLQRTTAHLFIVGDGCEKESLIRLGQELRIEKRLHFAGFVSPQNGLPEIYRMADVFITASETETQGIVLLEAAASGLPIVAVNATCVPEIVHDQVNGFLADPQDTEAFRCAVTTLIDDEKIAEAMGREGRILAGSHGIQESWNLHEKLYRDLNLQTRRLAPAGKPEIFLHWQNLKARIGIK